MNDAADRPLLAVDAGSPRVSVAVGGAAGVLAEASAEGRQSSGALLAMIEGVLADSGLRPLDLGGLVALRGPGSFTGLRVGLATVLGLHQALGLPATALPTLEVLGSLGPGDGSTVLAVVDALRGEWFAQPFRATAPPRPLAGPHLASAAVLDRYAPALVVGFGATGLADEATGLTALEPPPLAAVAVLQAGRYPLRWQPATLVEPLYLRPPSASPQGWSRRDAGGAP